MSIARPFFAITKYSKFHIIFARKQTQDHTCRQFSIQKYSVWLAWYLYCLPLLLPSFGWRVFGSAPWGISMLCLCLGYTNKRTITYCFPVFFHRGRINIAGNGDWFFLQMGGFFECRLSWMQPTLTLTFSNSNYISLNDDVTLQYELILVYKTVMHRR